jgi:hypothetical protein
MMEFSSYKALCADPSKAAEFLEHVSAVMERNHPRDHQRVLSESTLVAGQPVSSAKFLATLEMTSGDWDWDECGDEALKRFTQAAKLAEAVCPALRVAEFVFNFAALPGADAALVRARTSVVTHEVRQGQLITPPGIGGGILSPRAPEVRVQVTNDAVAQRPAMRMR